ncbi:MAG TPA: HD domain-containing phosphohydrolase [Gemmatimonadaceae bacterium]|nr:HD domain-containing phosphohydrolase [Gemmatimonadaceae bacterium]
MTSSADGTAARAPHLRLVDPAADHPSARALIDEGRSLDKLGRRKEARACYERALEALDPPAPSVASMLLRWIARTHEVDADYAAAASCAERAVALAEQGDDRNALGHALNVLAAVRWRQGDLDEAERLFHEALERGTSTTDPRLHVDVMTNLGSLAKIRGDFREALRCYEDALAHGRLHSLLDNILGTLNNLGIANMSLHRLDAAEDAFAEALTIANALGGLSIRIQLEVNGASLQIEKGDYAEAKRRCDRAMQLAAHLGDSRANAEAEKVYGIIARETGDLALAETHLARAREMASAVNDLEFEGDVNRELAELFDRLGRSRETLQALNRAHSCFTQLRARHELADVSRRMARLEGDFLDVVRQWGESIESKDQHTQGHCERVADLAGALAVKAGFDATSLFWFRIGALLHDVGKLIVPADVLNKPAQLTDDEWALMRLHPAAGVEMLAEVAFPWDVTPMVRSHHERWDGHGYPDRLAGDDIPLAARILCIADVYDALTTERSYKQAFSHLEAMEIMRRESGRQFDPQLFAKFEELVRRGTLNLPRTSERKREKRRTGAQTAVTVSEEDDLTGVLVRRAFVNVTSAVLAERRRTNATVSLLVIDVDQFKSVNDNFGHLTGDDALRLVAGLIREHLRPGQYVGRYAGDEFVALLPGLGGDAAFALADKMRATAGAMAIPLREAPGQSMHVTLSIGVATAPLHGESFETLFTAADRALFDAKRDGRDKVVLAGAATEGPPELNFTRFVGRGAEMRSLVASLDQSVQGSPQLYVVIGEAGVGKSTLLRQLLPEARLRGAVMVTGRSLETESRAPYRAWVEVIQALLDQGIGPARSWPMLERLVPSLQGEAGRTPPPPLDATQGFVLTQEIVAFLRGASNLRPIALVLEDMHWADSASWDVLEHVLAQLTTERVLIALTVRSEEATFGAVRERRQRLSRDERTRERRLERLTADEVREWLHGSLHRAELGDDLLDFVLRRTEGNPFLVTQLMRALAEENAFTHNGRTWVWTLPSVLQLPAGMSDLVGRRLNRLPPEALRILVTAAAIGRTFPIGLLADAASVSVDAVLDAVDAGLAASVLEPARELDDDSYQFAHVLLVDAVLTSVSPARQRLTHERVADLLATRTPDAVDRIASLYARSGNSAKAYAWCSRAATRALELHALDVATDFLKLALSHASTDEERFAVHHDLAVAAELSGRWADVERSCDAMLAMPSVLETPERALPLQQRRAQARLRMGQGVREMESECRELLAAAERLGAPAAIVRTRSLLVQTLQRLGRMDEAIEIAEEAQRLAQQSGDEALIAEAMHRLAHTVLGVRPRDAIELMLQLIALARRRADPLMEARGFLALGVARMRTRDDLAGVEAFRTALKLAMESQALEIAAAASMNLGVIELRRGDFTAAHHAFHEALRLYTTLRNNSNRLAALYNLANLEGERGDMDAATSLYRETATLAEQLGADDIAIGAHAGFGLAALRLTDVSGARTALAAAHRILGTREEWWFQGRERLESLLIRLAIQDGAGTLALARFRAAVERLEAMDVYSAAWLVGDCGAEVAAGESEVWSIVDRFGEHSMVRQFAPLAARFTALRDMANRQQTDRLRQGLVAECTGELGAADD